ncbi:DUF2163 domain-containing protein [Aliishimia ponticola]|uniref:DUF2163 domain-containing protein n=1 Tax=Aliishimia ponticola TaxID=2499833 RepID=A0A4S4NFF4_9RHOB|nr:DUF2163 domain-containing protein [Aliishimia ponticola]THH38316.1 DUF2163 domain-containing protein [Aliishimia ponticola]
MSGIPADLETHLKSGITTLCRAWAITRSDGVTFGFTDHDMPLNFEGIDFKADSGLTATALAQSTGLSVDNAEAVGALSDASISEADIEAGRFDGAQVLSWIVNWMDPSQKWLQFRGSIGEIRQGGGAFTAELRGLTDTLNQPIGRVYQKPCTAVLGDTACGVDLDQPGFSVDLLVEACSENRVFTWQSDIDFEAGWFSRGRVIMRSGAAEGLWGAVKGDSLSSGIRRIELWESIRAQVTPGDSVRLVAGCDKRWHTCRDKFANLLNFQGFPDIPGEDWLVAVPKSSGANTGGSRR